MKRTITFLCILIITSCEDIPKEVFAVRAAYEYIPSAYNEVGLIPTSDTIHFALREDTHNRIKNISLFTQNGSTYIAFYDKGSKSINVYDFFKRSQVLHVPLRTWITQTKLDKAWVCFRSFDSILVATKNNFLILDSFGTKKLEIAFEEGREGLLRNNALPVVQDGTIYFGVDPYINETSMKEQQQFKVLCGLDNGKRDWTFYYSLPELYSKGLYGYSFIDYSYCINDKGHFVFSFAADTNIYETNLKDYHHAYWAKSRFQTKNIVTRTAEELQKDSYKLYTMQDSYGAIVFDPYHKRYFRQAKQKITQADYDSKRWLKNRSVIVLDEDFKVIGEFNSTREFAFDQMIFLPDGKIYARTRAEDEYALHFVRLNYQESQPGQTKIAQHKL